jgi:hypothetical protein
MSRVGADGEAIMPARVRSQEPRVAENEKNENEHGVSVVQMVRGA